MTEPEIDALMAGQEDENGSVHYEGKLQLHRIPPLSLSLSLSIYYYLKDFNTRVRLFPAFVKHIMSV